MKIIGITGTSGSGKTTACEILSKKPNIKIIDADKIAKQMSTKGTEYLDSIKNEFGEKVFLEDGNLNRKELANIIYNSNQEKEKLNKLTQKHVIPKILENIKNSNEEYIIIDAAVLFEFGLNKECDYIISLTAPKRIKIERICKRDNISKEIAEKRINIQQTEEFYKNNSNYIIENDENCNLEKELEKIFEKINKGL